MGKHILQSVIEITGQRNLDSLEYSLVAALAELIPVSEISIYKKHSEAVTCSVEEVIALTITSTGTSEQDYQWSDIPRVIETDALTEQCLKTGSNLTQKTSNGQQNVFPIFSENIVIGALRLNSHNSIAGKTDLIEAILKIYSNYQVILIESERDKLTGLFNRRTFDHKLARLLQTHAKKNAMHKASGNTNNRQTADTDSSMWLVVLDLDSFKSVNDTYGHVYGDEILLTLSQKMKLFFRHTDLLFRFGGDEFVIVLEPTPFDNAYKLLENFRSLIAETSFPMIGNITISAGFSRITEKDYAPEVLNKADMALYHAKQCGRNTVCSYEQLLKQGLLTEKEQKTGAIDLF